MHSGIDPAVRVCDPRPPTRSMNILPLDICRLVPGAAEAGHQPDSAWTRNGKLSSIR
jgi:hypothetical protein